MSILIERYLFFLEHNKTLGDIMFESRGGKDDMRLKNSFEELYKNGTIFIKQDKFQNYLTSKQLKIKPKQNNISGLQLADLLAHPSRRDVLLKYGIINKEKNIFSDKIIQILQDKYYKRNGKIEGFGIKKLP